TRPRKRCSSILVPAIMCPLVGFSFRSDCIFRSFHTWLMDRANGGNLYGCDTTVVNPAVPGLDNVTLPGPILLRLQRRIVNSRLRKSQARVVDDASHNYPEFVLDDLEWLE